MDVHLLELPLKIFSIDGVTISDQIPWSGVPGKSLDNLASCPFCSGVFGHVEMDAPAAVMGQNHEDEQHAKADRWHGL